MAVLLTIFFIYRVQTLEQNKKFDVYFFNIEKTREVLKFSYLKLQKNY